jgi:1,4-dihydroxy-2-naphthoate polyprenyltransferase
MAPSGDPSGVPAAARGSGPGPAALWIEAMRLRTLPAAIAPVAIGVAIAASGGVAHAGAALAALTGALAIQIGTNFANDYFDFVKGTDDRPSLGRRRLLPSGMISPGTMARAAMIAFAVAVLVGLYLAGRGGWPVVAIGVASILAGILYTGGPMPYGYRGLGDVFVLVFFGPVAVAGTVYVQALAFDWRAVLAGFGPGLIATAILAVNNLRDAASDAASGKRTLAVILGPRFARIEHAACVLIGVAGVPLALVALGAAPAGVLLALGALIPAVPVIRSVATTDDPDTLNAALAGTGRVLGLYAVLVSVGWLI